jgi:hypothetical protein
MIGVKEFHRSIYWNFVFFDFKELRVFVYYTLFILWIINIIYEFNKLSLSRGAIDT